MYEENVNQGVQQTNEQTNKNGFANETSDKVYNDWLFLK